jgi:tetratricopeptide (TPR) repeat protein
MKNLSPKFGCILIAVAIKLAGCIGCAQSLAAPDQTDDIIKNSQAARWKLRRAGILPILTPPTPDSNPLRRGENAAKVQLQQVIDNVQSLKPPKQKPTGPTEILPVQPVPSTGSGQKPAPASPQPDKPVATRQRGPKTGANDETRRALAALIANPQNVLDPLAVAEALFQRGNMKDAAKFYALALKRIADKTDNLNRPWAMFQAANSIRYDDPAGAYQLYQQLIAEYPASDWTAAAHSQQQVITWYQQNSPKKILEKYISEPNSP